MNESISIAGLVLAGGRSSRFGGDKALAQFDERTLLELSLERFSPCRRRAVAVRDDGAVAHHACELGAQVVKDPPEAAAGPLAGIAAGLVWARANECNLLAIAPCDSPLLTWRHYERLADHMGDASAAFATTSASEHPLCAIWRCDLLPALTVAMTGGKHPSVLDFLRSRSARDVVFKDVHSFANANTVDELVHIATGAAR